MLCIFFIPFLAYGYFDSRRHLVFPIFGAAAFVALLALFFHSSKRDTKTAAALAACLALTCFPMTVLTPKVHCDQSLTFRHKCSRVCSYGKPQLSAPGLVFKPAELLWKSVAAVRARARLQASRCFANS
jgi:hypothetical protein